MLCYKQNGSKLLDGRAARKNTSYGSPVPPVLYVTTILQQATTLQKHRMVLRPRIGRGRLMLCLVYFYGHEDPMEMIGKKG
ncbi:hypothetical protein ScPMuIL_007938 [Solemya velum]